MKVVNHEDIPVELDVINLVYSLKRRAVPEIVRQYPAFDNEEECHCKLALDGQLRGVLWALGKDYRGKTILDLGCGSNNPFLEGAGWFRDSMYEPWLCRSLFFLGANPMGIDIGRLDGEKFRYIRANLNKDNVLSSIPDSSVDLANAGQLFSSPLLRKMGIDSGELKRKLLPQLERVCKPDAYFLIREDA